jgi:hypothetical protein
MARCELGYLCEVCGKEVADMVDSDLYLRFVLGEVPITVLHAQRERHIRCNPTLAQFIVDADFDPIICQGAFAKTNLDPESVAQEEERVTRAWRRLRQLPGLALPIVDYPLPEVRKSSEAKPAQ